MELTTFSFIVQYSHSNLHRRDDKRQIEASMKSTFIRAEVSSQTPNQSLAPRHGQESFDERQKVSNFEHSDAS